MAEGRTGTYSDSIGRYKQYVEAMKETEPVKTKTPAKTPVKKKKPAPRFITVEDLMGDNKSK